jgi:hypothetical protein
VIRFVRYCLLLLFRTILGVLCLLYISVRSDCHPPARSTLQYECRWNQSNVVQVSLYVVALSSTTVRVFDCIAHYEAHFGISSITGFATCNSKISCKQYRLHESIHFENLQSLHILTPNPSTSAMSLFRSFSAAYLEAPALYDTLALSRKVRLLPNPS